MEFKIQPGLSICLVAKHRFLKNKINLYYYTMYLPLSPVLNEQYIMYIVTQLPRCFLQYMFLFSFTDDNEDEDAIVNRIS